MKGPVRWMFLVLSVALVFAVGMLITPAETLAKRAGALAKQIQGSWVLVSVHNELDGKRTELYGPNPKGLLILTADGRCARFFMRADLPKFAANNRTKGTTEENQAVVQGSNCFFGTYTVNEKDQTITINIETSTFPNWDGTTQQRTVAIKGNELKVTNFAGSAGGTSYQVWKRAK